MKLNLNIGDLIMDMGDSEIGTVVSIGPGLFSGDPDYEDGCVPSWKVLWPSMGGKLFDVGEDDFLMGDFEIVSKA
jgi:hypothetical protein